MIGGMHQLVEAQRVVHDREQQGRVVRLRRRLLLRINIGCESWVCASRRRRVGRSHLPPLVRGHFPVVIHQHVRGDQLSHLAAGRRHVPEDGCQARPITLQQRGCELTAAAWILWIL